MMGSPYYHSKEHETEWGRAFNFDGEHSGPVREFVAQNAAYWVSECHLDGLRIDATQAMVDDSAEHIVTQLTRTARAAAGRREALALHRDLLRLRRTDPMIARQEKSAIEGSVIGAEAFALRWYSEDGDDRLLLVNLGRDCDWQPLSDPLAAAPRDRRWQMVWSSEDPRYGGSGTAKLDARQWHVPGHTAVLVAAVEP